MTRLRPLRSWWASQHARLRVPWCWQCRLGWRRDGGFYEHDEAAWQVRELAAHVDGTTPPTSTYWWSFEHGLRRWGG